MEDKIIPEVTSYNGDAPYIFISYAHKDSDVVIPAIRAMQEKGYRVWFDLGIEVGTEWSNNIAAHLRDCAVFVAFISSNSVRSENCLDEIAYAKSHQKSSLLIFIEEDVTLPEGTEMQTARFQRMFLTRQESMDGFTDNLDKSAMFDPCRGEPVVSAKPATATPASPKPQKAAPKAAINKKPLIIGLAAAVALVVLLCVILIPGSGGDKPSAGLPSTSEDNTPVEMSDNLTDYTFKLDGVVYRLPFAFSQLTKNGWTISSRNYSSETLVVGRGKDTLSVVKDGKEIAIGIYNNSGNASPIANCMVGQIDVEAGSGAAFEIAKGIVPSSTADEVIAAFGTPQSRNDKDDYARLFYGEEEFSDIGVTFLCYKNAEDSKYSEISIERYTFEENTTKTNEEKPAFLAEYAAPSALGSDLFASILMIDGDLYQFPAPVDAFLKNGWVVSSSSNFVVAGGKDSIKLTRNDKKIELTVLNGAEYQTIPQNCVAVTISESDTTGCITLPGDIKIGMKKADLDAKVPSTMEVYDGTYTTNYSYSEYKEREFSLSLSVDKETGLLSNIRLINYTWPFGEE